MNMSMREIDNGCYGESSKSCEWLQHGKQKFCALPENRMECITFVFLFSYVFIRFNVELHDTQRKRRERELQLQPVSMCNNLLAGLISSMECFLSEIRISCKKFFHIVFTWFSLDPSGKCNRASEVHGRWENNDFGWEARNSRWSLNTVPFNNIQKLQTTIFLLYSSLTRSRLWLVSAAIFNFSPTPPWNSYFAICMHSNRAGTLISLFH